MYIVQKFPNEDGYRSGLQTFNGETLPNGYVKFPEESYDSFYPPNKLCSGFVTFDIENETATNVEWNEEAYQAYIDSLPEPLPEPEPMTQAEVEEMLLDQEYRLLLLEYGLEEEEPS